MASASSGSVGRTQPLGVRKVSSRTRSRSSSGGSASHRPDVRRRGRQDQAGGRDEAAARLGVAAVLHQEGRFGWERASSAHVPPFCFLAVRAWRSLLCRQCVSGTAECRPPAHRGLPAEPGGLQWRQAASLSPATRSRNGTGSRRARPLLFSSIL